MQIEESIVQALKNVGMPSNITTILSDRDGVEPQAPYLIVQILNTSDISLPRVTQTHVEGNIKEDIYTAREFNISLTFHASTKGDTHDWVQYFYSGLTSDLVQWAFTQQGVGLGREDGITYLSQTVNGKNYKDAVLNLTLNAEIHNQYTVNPLNGIETQGFLRDEIGVSLGDVVVDIDINN